ncbi:hypothetical protein ACQHIV_39315 [Kribbella sp. GL6]|uniref:hypothetical protein n=1 Tax=Kribbella sp. GL6 TaxID=3419765 RepID=UPI003D01CC4E
MLGLIQLPHALRSGGGLRVLAIVVTAAVLVGVCVSGWQLVTLRPVLTVDAAGVRVGRRRFVAWHEIAGITELSRDGFRVVPRGRRRKLRIDEQYVRDVAAFRWWLGDLVDKQRAGVGEGCVD